MLAAEEGRWIACNNRSLVIADDITMPDFNDGGALSAQTGNPGIMDIFVILVNGRWSGCLLAASVSETGFRQP